jgi:hypothetical protein
MRWLLAVAVAALLLGGCGRGSVVRAEAVDRLSAGLLAPSAEPGSLEEARQALAYYQALVPALERAAAAQRQEAQRRWLAWAMGLALAGAVLCAGLAVALPVGRRVLVSVALGCAGAAAAAWLLGQALAWLSVVAAVAAAVAVAWVAWALWARLRCAIRTVDVAADRGDSAHWEALKAHMMAAQGALQPDMDRLAHLVRRERGGDDH